MPRSRKAKPAKSLDVRGFYHLLHLTGSEHPTVALFASGLVITSICALRLRDAQRASLFFDNDDYGFFRGVTFTSKHPKRRQPLPMDFYAPIHGPVTLDALRPMRYLALKMESRDYIFPQPSFPRGGSVADPKAVIKDLPAATSTVIRQFRAMLTMPPLSLTESQAAELSGHSPRHLVQTLMRLWPKDFTKPERDEANRYAATQDESSTRGSMPNRYSAEAEEHAVLPVIRRVLDKLAAVVDRVGLCKDGLPNVYSWKDLADVSADALVVSDLPAEASSSGSASSDSEATLT